MESWSQDFLDMIQATVDEMGQFAIEIVEEVGSAVDSWVDTSESWIEQFHLSLETEFEQRLNEFFDPILEAFLGFEVTFEETAHPLIHTVEPILNEHTACVGCRHYHGQVYGDNLLICGMHPYGWEEEQCPDWESTWQRN